MSRNPLYDTQTYVRKNIDLQQGAVFGILAAILMVSSKYVSTTNLTFSLSIAGTLLLYFAVLSFTLRAQALTIILWSGVFLFPSMQTFLTGRLLIFAILILLCSHSRFALLPFFAVLFAWLALCCTHLPLFATLTAQYPLIQKLPLSAETGYSAMFEIFGVLVLHFFLWSPRLANFMRRNQRPVDTRSVLTALSLVTFLGASLVILHIGSELFGISLDTFLARASTQPMIFVIGIGSLLFGPVLIGTAMSQLINDFSLQLRELSDPSKRVFMPKRGLPSLKEFKLTLDEMRTMIDTTLLAQKEAQLAYKTVLSEMAKQEAEIQIREQDAANLERLMSAAPLGYLAVTGGGAMLAANRKFFELADIPENHKVGEHYTTLLGDSVWRREVFSMIAYVLKDPQIFAEKGKYRSYTSLKDHAFLQVDCYLTTTAQLEIAETRTAKHLALSDFAVTVFVREIADLREFELHRIIPSTFTMLGAHAIEHCRQLRQETRTLAETHKQASRDIALALQDPRLSKYADSLLFMREAAEFAERSSAQLETFHDQFQLSNTELEKIDLISLFRNSLDRLYELLGLDEEAVLELEDAFTQEQHTEYLIEVPQSEFFSFLAAVLAVIKAILPRAPELLVHLGRETIGANTATFIPNSAPGQYARIVIQHPGQSITANMVPNNIRMVSPIMDGSNDIEASLAILSMQVHRLKGFLSMMSSHNKGTTITLYIPESPNLIERRPREIERTGERRSFNPPAAEAVTPLAPPPQFDENGMTPPKPLSISPQPAEVVSPAGSEQGGEQTAPTRLLILSEQFDTGARIERLLSSIGARVSYHGPQPRDGDTEDLFGFGGAGFDAPKDEPNSFTPGDHLPISLDEFDIVVIGESAFVPDYVKCIREMRNNVPVLVVGTEPPDEPEPNTFYLSPPVDGEVICRATRRLIAKGQQSNAARKKAAEMLAERDELPPNETTLK